ncbi:elongation factor 1-gamma-like [Lineus longissimus]|uniref:elongation factor 1-gamma-like n=1 Tax=Lineus longissimus TaxID=88925 RepID=UPI002B4CCBD7
MATGTLYTYPENFRAFKVLVAAKYSGTNVTVADKPPKFKFSETNKTDDFLKKFPLGKVPAYEAEDGTTLFESNAIARYVANGKLHGSCNTSAALVDQWINFGDNEILPSACTWVFPCLGFMQYNKQNTEAAKETIKRALRVLDAYLKTRTYLVGERISQADISVCCNLLALYQHVLEPSFRAPFPHVNRWFTTLINQPNFKAVIGEFKLCVKMAQFDSKKYAELNKKDQGGKKEKKPQPKQEPKMKEEKTEEKEVDLPPPKRKNAFEELPPGKFNFEAWNRLYFNEDDVIGKSVPYFWQNYDKENLCLYKGTYKEEDLAAYRTKPSFMINNLIGGWFQRLDAIRKYGIGIAVVTGEEGNLHAVTALFVSRGNKPYHEIAADTIGGCDHLSYDWEILDPEKPEVKEMVTEYLVQEPERDYWKAHPLLSVKNFH